MKCSVVFLSLFCIFCFTILAAVNLFFFVCKVEDMPIYKAVNRAIIEEKTKRKVEFLDRLESIC